MELKKYKMVSNKLILELRARLCLGNNKKMSAKIITNMFKILQQHHRPISPTCLVETAVFNLLIPIISRGPELQGKFLQQTIVRALLSIIKYAKDLRTNSSIAHKLAIIFIQLYKKDHSLYKHKLVYLNKILNI